MYARAKKHIIDIKHQKDFERLKEREELDDKMQAHLLSLKRDTSAIEAERIKLAQQEQDRKFIAVCCYCP